MTILLHTSKTMRPTSEQGAYAPQLLAQASELATYIKTLPVSELTKAMHLSPALAQKTAQTYNAWQPTLEGSSPAVNTFVGDIYSGLQAGTFTAEDRAFAHEHLRILSGLYGVLRPYDGIYPYRLEMGYRLPHQQYRNLYDFWKNAIADTIDRQQPIVNLVAVEYSKAVLPYVITSIFTPRFLTVNTQTNEPAFVVVHAKIARGAFARWMITHKITESDALTTFDELGYRYDALISTPSEPVFVCREFGGKGLSIRLG